MNRCYPFTAALLVLIVIDPVTTSTHQAVASIIAILAAGLELAAALGRWAADYVTRRAVRR